MDIGEAGPIDLDRVFCKMLATPSYVIGEFYDSISVCLVRRNDHFYYSLLALKLPAGGNRREKNLIESVKFREYRVLTVSGYCT